MLKQDKFEEKSLEDLNYFSIWKIAQSKEKVSMKVLVLLWLFAFYTPQSEAYDNIPQMETYERDNNNLDRIEIDNYVKESLARLNWKTNLGDLSYWLSDLKHRLELVVQQIKTWGRLDRESLKRYWELIGRYYEKVSHSLDIKWFESIYWESNFWIITKEAGVLGQLVIEITELLTEINQLSEHNEWSWYRSIAKVEVKRWDILTWILITQFRMTEKEAIRYLRFYREDIKTINRLKSLNNIKPWRTIILPDLQN